MSATGDYIREAREQKGLTLGQVEEATRIPRYYLEILEGGGDDRLVSDRLYMVHFLRTYAEYLEVEVETLAAQFVRENRRAEALVAAPVVRRRSWKPVMAAALAVVLLVAAGTYVLNPDMVDFRWTDLVSSPPPPAKEPSPRPLPVAAPTPRPDDPNNSVLQPEADETAPSEPNLVAAPPPAENPSAPNPEPTPSVETPHGATAAPVTPVSSIAEPPEKPAPPAGQQALVSTAEKPASTPDPPETPATAAVEDRAPEPSSPERSSDETRDPGATEPAAVAAVPQPPVPPEGDPAATHSLVISAEQKAWLRVWVDDRPYRDMLLEPGETRTMSAQTGFRITFGNAGGVLLTLNGVELPRAGRPGQVLRDYTLPATPRDTP